MFAVVRVRGEVGLKKEIRDTMNMLRLNRVNHCVIIPQDPVTNGMIRKVKDWVTWGEVSDAVLEKLIAARGRLKGDNPVDKDGVKKALEIIKKEGRMTKTDIKPVLRLSPPKKGYVEIKQAYPRGALGYRGEKINDLLMRMI